MTHTTATIVMTAVFAGAFQLLGVATEPEPYITVESLDFASSPAGPEIIQTRTVTAQDALVAQWTAKIITNDEGGEVTLCEGAGSFKYATGTKSPAIPLNEWVGQEGCWESLPYFLPVQAEAVYEWGDGKSTEQTSLLFRRTPEGLQ